MSSALVGKNVVAAVLAVALVLAYAAAFSGVEDDPYLLKPLCDYSTGVCSDGTDMGTGQRNVPRIHARHL